MKLWHSIGLGGSGSAAGTAGANTNPKSNPATAQPTNNGVADNANRGSKGSGASNNVIGKSAGQQAATTSSSKQQSAPTSKDGKAHPVATKSTLPSTMSSSASAIAAVFSSAASSSSSVSSSTSSAEPVPAPSAVKKEKMVYVADRIVKHYVSNEPNNVDADSSSAEKTSEIVHIRDGSQGESKHAEASKYVNTAAHAAAITKKLGTSEYMAVIGAVVDDPSGPFQEFVLRVEDALLSYVYGQKGATPAYIDCLVAVFNEAVAANFMCIDISDCNALFHVYALSPVGQLKASVRMLAQQHPTQFVEMIEQFSDQAIAKYNASLEAASGPTMALGALGNLANKQQHHRNNLSNMMISNAKPFRRQMLKEHCQSMSFLLDKETYKLEVMVLEDEPCVEVLHIMKSMLVLPPTNPPQANAVVGIPKSPADISNRPQWQTFAVNVFGCGSHHIRGLYIPKLAADTGKRSPKHSPSKPGDDDEEDPCYVHPTGFVLQRWRKHVEVPTSDSSSAILRGGADIYAHRQLTISKRIDGTGANSKHRDVIHMLLWVIWHPKLHTLYYYCPTIDPTPLPPLLGWRVVSPPIVRAHTTRRRAGINDTANARYSHSYGVAPVPHFTIVLDFQSAVQPMPQPPRKSQAANTQQTNAQNALKTPVKAQPPLAPPVSAQAAVPAPIHPTQPAVSALVVPALPITSSTSVVTPTTVARLVRASSKASLDPADQAAYNRTLARSADSVLSLPGFSMDSSDYHSGDAVVISAHSRHHSNNSSSNNISRAASVDSNLSDITINYNGDQKNKTNLEDNVTGFTDYSTDSSSARDVFSLPSSAREAGEAGVSGRMSAPTLPTHVPTHAPTHEPTHVPLHASEVGNNNSGTIKRSNTVDADDENDEDDDDDYNDEDDDDEDSIDEYMPTNIISPTRPSPRRSRANNPTLLLQSAQQLSQAQSRHQQKQHLFSQTLTNTRANMVTLPLQADVFPPVIAHRRGRSSGGSNPSSGSGTIDVGSNGGIVSVNSSVLLNRITKRRQKQQLQSQLKSPHTPQRTHSPQASHTPPLPTSTPRSPQRAASSSMQSHIATTAVRAHSPQRPHTSSTPSPNGSQQQQLFPPHLQRHSRTHIDSDGVSHVCTHVANSLEECHFASSNYIIAHIAKRRTRMRNINTVSELLSEYDAYTIHSVHTHHDTFVHTHLDAALERTMAAFSVCAIRDRLIKHCVTMKAFAREELKHLERKNRWLEAAAGDDLLFGYESTNPFTEPVNTQTASPVPRAASAQAHTPPHTPTKSPAPLTVTSTTTNNELLPSRAERRASLLRYEHMKTVLQRENKRKNKYRMQQRKQQQQLRRQARASNDSDHVSSDDTDEDDEEDDDDDDDNDEEQSQSQSQEQEQSNNNQTHGQAREQMFPDIQAPAADEVEAEQRTIYSSFTNEWHIESLLVKLQQQQKHRYKHVVPHTHSVDSHESDSSSLAPNSCVRAVSLDSLDHAHTLASEDGEDSNSNADSSKADTHSGTAALANAQPSSTAEPQALGIVAKLKSNLPTLFSRSNVTTNTNTNSNSTAAAADTSTSSQQVVDSSNTINSSGMSPAEYTNVVKMRTLEIQQKHEQKQLLRQQQREQRAQASAHTTSPTKTHLTHTPTKTHPNNTNSTGPIISKQFSMSRESDSSFMAEGVSMDSEDDYPHHLDPHTQTNAGSGAGAGAFLPSPPRRAVPGSPATVFASASASGSVSAHTTRVPNQSSILHTIREATANESDSSPTDASVRAHKKRSSNLQQTQTQTRHVRKHSTDIVDTDSASASASNSTSNSHDDDEDDEGGVLFRTHSADNSGSSSRRYDHVTFQGSTPEPNTSPITNSNNNGGQSQRSPRAKEEAVSLLTPFVELVEAAMKEDLMNEFKVGCVLMILCA
jgi:hypothetical protein